MRVEATPLKDCYIIHDTVFEDSRGYFFESFNQQNLQRLQAGIIAKFLFRIINRLSVRGVLRAISAFSAGGICTAKLVRIARCGVRCGSGHKERLPDIWTTFCYGVNRHIENTIVYTTWFCTWFYCIDRYSSFLL